MSDSLPRALEAFDALSPPGGYSCPRSATFGEQAHEATLVFGSMIHGDEVGSLPGVLQVMEELASGQTRFGGKVTFFVGNSEAGLQGARFLESDLNRVFHDDPPDTHEGRRAQELRPLLDDCSFFLDLHQTILATREPFYISPFHPGGWHWARALAGARSWVTRHPGQAFSSGTCCADEYVRLKGRAAMTLELGQKGFHPDAAERAATVIRRALALSDAQAAGASSLPEQAAQEPELRFYETVHREPFASEDHALRPELVNFQPVNQGELLSGADSPELRAPATGMLLFPKYPPVVDGRYKQPLPKEIYRVIRELPEHPSTLYASG